MEEPDNKSILSSVLFLDIVEYSRKTVSEQIALKDGFHAFLSASLQGVPVENRIVLDTGDGAVINFLGEASDALTVALGMRERLLSTGASMHPPLLVRMGINLGPVRMIKDINGLPNIVGDGINVAQRVMGFAAPGQILVSQSYFDMVSNLSREYAGMFHYQGSRTDKHVREHEVYAIGYPAEFAETQKNPAISAERSNPFSRLLARLVNIGHIADGWFYFMGATYKNSSTSMRTVVKLTVLAMLLMVLAVLIGKITPRLVTHDSQVANMPDQIAAPAPSSVADSSIPVNESANEAPKQLQSKQKPSQVKIARIRTLEETTAINVGAPALVNLAVTPWGEIYLDGRMQGVSPPLAELQVVAGEHVIEIRNTTFPAYSQKFRVQPGGKIKIKHKFGN